MPKLIDADEFKRIAAGCVFETPKGLRIKAEIAIDARPAVDAEPVRHGFWMHTDETIWEANEIDGKQRLEIAIVAACCSVCKRWAEQVNKTMPRMVYERCPHCGAIMDAKPPKNKPEVKT